VSPVPSRRERPRPSGPRKSFPTRTSYLRKKSNVSAPRRQNAGRGREGSAERSTMCNPSVGRGAGR
jgi:hypothetical protein